MVPVKRSSLYMLSRRILNGRIHENATWTEVSQDGPKGFLTARDLCELILSIKRMTTGGISYSTSEIRNEVENKIVSVYRKNKRSHLLPSSIPQHTLNVYVSIIQSQSIFNIYSSMSNKTESRSVAEWSIRSTIAYTMIVATNHFIPGIARTPFHPKKKDLSSRSVEMWDTVEEAYNKMLGNERNKIEMMPVLPNLVTTTDEVTIFATSSIVNSEESLYIVARPEELKNEMSSSGCRNHYKQRTSGDSHCRGVRIVINSTFTAGGLSAPIFVTVFGLSNEEMSGSSIITVEVPGLTVGSHQDVYSAGVGFLTFVRGSGSYNDAPSAELNCEMNENETNQQNISIPTISKESKIAQLYRKKVYYPFISHIRRTKYDFDGGLEDIPDYLKCVSWMDGCNSQLRLITSEENMKEEQLRKIVCCKHSAARTAVEQAADTGSMFKQLKKIVRTTENPTSGNSAIYHHLQKTFDRLRNEPTDADSLHLPSHKKKAIILTLAKLPIAASRAYGDHVIKKAFLLNGQLDINHQIVPDLENCLNTYRGNISGTCLEDKKKLIEELYEETYSNGMIMESTFDNMKVPRDVNCHGDTISRDFGIRNENRQRAKCLTSKKQIEERHALVLESKLMEYRKKMVNFETEDKIYEGNKVCEMKLMAIFDELCFQQSMDNSNTDTSAASMLPPHNEKIDTFNCMADKLTYSMVKNYKGKINLLKTDMKSFVRVRSDRVIRNGKITYISIPDLKDELLKKLIEFRTKDVADKAHKVRPLLPE